MALSFSPDQLPRAPYASGAKGAIVQAWRPGHWFNYMWEAESWSASTIHLGRGGYQGGQQGVEGAEEWFVE